MKTPLVPEALLFRFQAIWLLQFSDGFKKIYDFVDYLAFSFFFFFLNVYYMKNLLDFFILERESCKQRRRAEGGERILSRLHTQPRGQHRAQFHDPGPIT